MARVSVILLLSTALVGCTGHGTIRPGVLRAQLSTEPVSLDPSLAEDGASIRILTNTWRGLLDLASPPEVSRDGKKYTFTLKEGALWSDGIPVRAQDFRLGMRRALAPETAAKLAPLLYPIRGAQDFHAGKSKELEGVVVQGERRLMIELERPAPYLLKALALSIAMPLRQDILDANHGKWPADGPSTGPFHLSGYSRGQKITLTRTGRPARAGEVQEVEMPIVADEGAAVGLFEGGKIDVMTRVPTLEMRRLSRSGVVRTDPFLATYYLGFNVKKPPFDRSEMRRKVALSVKKSEIAAAVATGETPARSWIPPGLEGSLPWQEPPVAQIERVSPSFSPVPASFDTSARNSLVMEKVQNDLLRGAGIRLSLQNLDWKSYIHLLQTDAPPLFRFAWLAPIEDPVPHLQVFTSGNPNNYTGWSSAKYDALVREIERMSPSAARSQRILLAQKILLEEDVVIVPIYHYVQNHAVSRRVKKFRVNPFGVIPFDEIELNE